MERSLREIRLNQESGPHIGETPGEVSPAIDFLLPGEVRSPEYDLWLRAECTGAEPTTLRPAILRNWRSGDRVTLRYSRGPKKVAEVLDRLQVVGAARKNWPVVESDGKIIWMRGVEVDASGWLFRVVT